LVSESGETWKSLDGQFLVSGLGVSGVELVVVSGAVVVVDGEAVVAGLEESGNAVSPLSGI
jgi:hypothetical protein